MTNEMASHYPLLFEFTQVSMHNIVYCMCVVCISVQTWCIQLTVVVLVVIVVVAASDSGAAGCVFLLKLWVIQCTCGVWMFM